MELLHQAGETINRKYHILDILAQGGIGITYVALNLENGKILALKVLSLHRMTGWKKMELFSRESQILSQLNHPAIPSYLDYFQIKTDNHNSFYIAQQLAPGKSLLQLLETGWHPHESEVRDIAIQILDILIYLHSFSPPVIHRDIKPQNIIRSNNRQVFLVDFGAVADTYHNTITGGSTVVGTFGYMAPEQFRGKALPSTDLYGLATTLLHLLTGKSPADLPQKNLKIDFRSQIRLSKSFADWLEKMLQPIPEDRFPNAEIALAVLQGKESLHNYHTEKSRKPKNTPISLFRNQEELHIEIPAGKFHNNYKLILGMLILLVNGLLLLTFIAIFQHFHVPNMIPGLLGFFCLFLFYVFIGLKILDTSIIIPMTRIKLTISKYNFQHKFCYQRWLWFKQFQKIEGKLSENRFREIFNSIKFNLNSNEKRWLKAEINNFLEL
ncbi:MAG: serine/threonine-protein kinase [Cyanobacteria bacterium P01_D01_bin.50]